MSGPREVPPRARKTRDGAGFDSPAVHAATGTTPETRRRGHPVAAPVYTRAKGRTMHTTMRQDEALDLLAEQYATVEVDVREATGVAVARCWAPGGRVKLATYVLDENGRADAGCVQCGFARVSEQGAECETCKDQRLDLAHDAAQAGELGHALIAGIALMLLVCAAVTLLVYVATARAATHHARPAACRTVHRHKRCARPRIHRARERTAPDPEDAGTTTTTLTRPELSPAQQAWVDAQTYPPEVKRYLEDAVGFWNAVPDSPVVLRLAACELPGAEHSGGCEYVDAGRYIIDLYPGCYPTPTAFIPDPSLVGFAVLVTHEVGHALGHTHAEGGIMDGGNPYAAPFPYEQEVTTPNGGTL